MTSEQDLFYSACVESLINGSGNFTLQRLRDGKKTCMGFQLRINEAFCRLWCNIEIHHMVDNACTTPGRYDEKRKLDRGMIQWIGRLNNRHNRLLGGPVQRRLDCLVWAKIVIFQLHGLGGIVRASCTFPSN